VLLKQLKVLIGIGTVEWYTDVAALMVFFYADNSERPSPGARYKGHGKCESECDLTLLFIVEVNNITVICSL